MSKNIKNFEKVGERVWLSTIGGAIVQFSSRRNEYTAGMVNRLSIAGKFAEVMYHGKSNNLPQERERLIQRNAYLPNLHVVQRNLLLGDAFIAYRKIKENGVTRVEEVDFPKQLTDKFPLDYIAEINEAVTNEYVKHAQAFPQFVWRKDGSIAPEGIKVHKNTEIRAERQNADTGLIDNWYYSNSWVEKTDVLKKPVLEKISNMTLSRLRSKMEDGKRWKQGSFIFPIQDTLHNDGYYAVPPVDGVRDAVELSNAVWLFHESNLKNGYNLRWHIEIPEDYFYDYESVEKGTVTEIQAAEDATDKEQDFINKMNDFLAGADNAGKAIYTKKLIRNIEKEYPGISIKALEYDMKDDALLKLEQRAMIATLSNQGVPPILASVQLPEGFGSGSQIRGILGMYQIVNLPFMRSKIFSWLNVLKYTEGLPSDIFYGVKDRELTTLDANPTGSQKVTVSN